MSTACRTVSTLGYDTNGMQVKKVTCFDPLCECRLLSMAGGLVRQGKLGIRNVIDLSLCERCLPGSCSGDNIQRA